MQYFYCITVFIFEHIRTCVADDIKKGNDEKTEELVELLKKIDEII